MSVERKDPPGLSSFVPEPPSCEPPPPHPALPGAPHTPLAQLHLPALLPHQIFQLEPNSAPCQRQVVTSGMSLSLRASVVICEMGRYTGKGPGSASGQDWVRSGGSWPLNEKDQPPFLSCSSSTNTASSSAPWGGEGWEKQRQAPRVIVTQGKHETQFLHPCSGASPLATSSPPTALHTLPDACELAKLGETARYSGLLLGPLGHLRLSYERVWVLAGLVWFSS